MNHLKSLNCLKKFNSLKKFAKTYYIVIHSHTKSYKAKGQFVCLSVNFALIEMLTHIKTATKSNFGWHLKELLQYNSLNVKNISTLWQLLFQGCPPKRHKWLNIQYQPGYDRTLSDHSRFFIIFVFQMPVWGQTSPANLPTAVTTTQLFYLKLF